MDHRFAGIGHLENVRHRAALGYFAEVVTGLFQRQYFLNGRLRVGGGLGLRSGGWGVPMCET